LRRGFRQQQGAQRHRHRRAAVGEAGTHIAVAAHPEPLDPIKTLTGRMFNGAPVIPFMSTGATDSRYLRAAAVDGEAEGAALQCA